MKFYHQIQKIALSEDSIRKASRFADAVLPTVDYSDSNQFQKDKIKNDHFISKLGEESVKQVFEQFTRVDGPDYTIYEGKRKSWTEDLFINGVGLSVKTQKVSVAKKYGLSWTFQSNSIRRDKILSEHEAWICFVALDDTASDLICHVYPPCQMKELKFGEPKLPHLRGHKKVVYASSFLGLP